MISLVSYRNDFSHKAKIRQYFLIKNELVHFILLSTCIIFAEEQLKIKKQQDGTIQTNSSETKR